jgi:hypothetical protein
MAEWGRKEYRKHGRAGRRCGRGRRSSCRCVFFAGMLTLEYEHELDSRRAAVPVGLPEERGAGQSVGDGDGKYTLLEAVVGKGQRLVIGDEIEPVPSPDGRPGTG